MFLSLLGTYSTGACCVSRCAWDLSHWGLLCFSLRLGHFPLRSVVFLAGLGHFLLGAVLLLSVLRTFPIGACSVSLCV